MVKFGVHDLKTVGGSHPMPQPPKPDDVPQAAEEAAPGVREEIAGKDVTILYEGTRCIHARFCVLGAPAVFKANTPGDWIFPDAMDKEAVVRIAHACPSGAIRYKRNDGVADEQPPPVNVAGIRENGPYAFRADLKMGDLDVGYARNALPLRRFEAQAVLRRLAQGDQLPRNRRAADARIRSRSRCATGRWSSSRRRTVRWSSPATSKSVRAPGRTIDRVTKARLCRCGGSRNKPFCDNTHLRNGFEAPGA